jgi:hypothetical protein
MSGNGPTAPESPAFFLSLDLSAIELPPDAGLPVRHIIVQADPRREYVHAVQDTSL